MIRQYFGVELQVVAWYTVFDMYNYKKQLRNPLFLTQVCITIIPFIFFGWLAVQYFSFFGTLRISYDFSQESPYVQEFTPRGRALDREENLRTGESYQRVIGEPAYMKVAVPRSFDSVDVTIEYQNPDQPIVEFGVVTSTEPWNTQLQPFHSSVINEAVSEKWDLLESDGVTLLQREKQFDSVDSFIESFPRDVGIGTYGYNLTRQYYDPEYVPKSGGVVVDRFLRGRHEFWTYAANENLRAEFDFVDINRSFDEDPILLQVYQGDMLVHEELLPDDGITEATGVSSETRTLSVDLPDVEGSLYRYVLSVNDDIVVTQIRTDQDRFIAKGSVYLVNNEEYAAQFPDLSVDETRLTMQATTVFARTDHPAGLQVPTVNGDPMHIDTVSRPYYWTVPEADQSEIAEVIVPKNDLYLQSNGYFAFSPESFFDPDYGIQKIDETVLLDELDYILYSDYVPPEEGRLNLTQQTTIDLQGVFGDRKELTFVLSAPGIDRAGNELKIFSVDFEFHRAPLYQRIIDRLRK